MSTRRSFEPVVSLVNLHGVTISPRVESALRSDLIELLESKDHGRWNDPETQCKEIESAFYKRGLDRFKTVPTLFDDGVVFASIYVGEVSWVGFAYEASNECTVNNDAIGAIAWRLFAQRQMDEAFSTNRIESSGVGLPGRDVEWLTVNQKDFNTFSVPNQILYIFGRSDSQTQKIEIQYKQKVGYTLLDYLCITPWLNRDDEWGWLKENNKKDETQLSFEVYGLKETRVPLRQVLGRWARFNLDMAKRKATVKALPYLLESRDGFSKEDCKELSVYVKYLAQSSKVDAKKVISIIEKRLGNMEWLVDAQEHGIQEILVELEKKKLIESCGTLRPKKTTRKVL